MSATKKPSERQVRLMRKALKECLEVLNLSDPEGHRAAGISAPEDPMIRDLCERIGYGAVMDSAARQWRNKDAIGATSAHTHGAAVFTIQKTVALVKKALGAK